MDQTFELSKLGILADKENLGKNMSLWHSVLQVARVLKRLNVWPNCLIN
jgi:hypothetical protein